MRQFAAAEAQKIFKARYLHTVKFAYRAVVVSEPRKLLRVIGEKSEALRFARIGVLNIFSEELERVARGKYYPAAVNAFFYFIRIRTQFLKLDYLVLFLAGAYQKKIDLVFDKIRLVKKRCFNGFGFITRRFQLFFKIFRVAEISEKIVKFGIE